MSTDKLNKGDYILFGNYPQRRVFPYEAIYEKLNECYTGTETEIEYDGKKYAVVREPEFKSWPYIPRLQKFRWRNIDYIFFEYKPILWRVLDVVDDKAYLFSEYVIDCQTYNDSIGCCKWRESTLRTWLNYSREGFFNRAFSSEEKKMILNREITIASDEKGETKALIGYEKEAQKIEQKACEVDWGPTVFNEADDWIKKYEQLLDDKVVLLSAEEIFNQSYGFKPITKIDEFDNEKTASPTEYALANYACVESVNEDNNIGCPWFVRSFSEGKPYRTSSPGFALSNGFMSCCYDNYGHGFHFQSGIRPVIWVENKDFNGKKVCKENSFDYDNLYTERLVCFGRYPQKEVNRHGNLYVELYSQDWEEKDEIEYKGYKYRRVKRPAEKKSLPESVKSFKWGEHEYAFFSYSPIVWRVLQADEEGVLLISERVLDHKKIGEESWEVSQIRDWLNSYPTKKVNTDTQWQETTFFDAAFNTEEKELIKTRKIVLKAAGEFIKKWTAQPVNRTELKDDDFMEAYDDDKVILLTEEDVFNENYGFKGRFKNGSGNGARVAIPTEYAMGKGSLVATYTYEECCDWGTRTFINEKFVHKFTGVGNDGTVFEAYKGEIGIRPAIYVERSVFSRLDFIKKDVKE